MFTLSPKTRRLVELFREADYGTEFTYAQVLEKAECDLTGRDRQRIYSANRILERDHRRTILNMRGRGYKVAFPREHAEAMTLRKHRAGMHIERAAKTGRATPIALLSESELRTWTDVQVGLTRVAQALSYHDRRLARIESHLGIAPEPTVEGSAEEVQGEGSTDVARPGRDRQG